MELLFKICQFLYRQKSTTPDTSKIIGKLFTYDLVADPG